MVLPVPYSKEQHVHFKEDGATVAADGATVALDGATVALDDAIEFNKTCNDVLASDRIYTHNTNTMFSLVQYSVMVWFSTVQKKIGGK